jgi:hypothetical protein
VPLQRLHSYSPVCRLLSICAPSGAKLSVVEGDQLLSENWPAVHTVGRAAARPPVVVDITWQPASSSSSGDLPMVALVGKGVCFDSGGGSPRGSAVTHSLTGKRQCGRSTLCNHAVRRQDAPAPPPSSVSPVLLCFPFFFGSIMEACKLLPSCLACLFPSAPPPPPTPQPRPGLDIETASAIKLSKGCAGDSALVLALATPSCLLPPCPLAPGHARTTPLYRS